MWFWIFMFFCNLLVPLIMIIAGKMMWQKCPGKINRVYGYRTKRSMKNMETWKFAHEHCGKLWWKIGWMMLVVTCVVQIPFIHSSEDVIGKLGTVLCSIQLIVLLGSIIPTEVALKKKFFDE